MDKKSGFTTVYEAPEAGTLAFDSRRDFEDEIETHLEVLRELQTEFKDKEDIAESLHEIAAKLAALKVSTEPVEAVQKKLKALTQVPFGEGKNLDLAAFRKKSPHTKIADPEAYLDHVRKLVRNTTGNLTQLLHVFEDDNILQRFLAELQKLDVNSDYRTVRHAMDKLAKSPQLWHYNEKKKAFLLEWLRPFQEELGKPIDNLSAEELQEALKKVGTLRESKLEMMTNLVQEKNRGPFRKYNREMHAVMNGRNKDFWSGAEVRDEFIALMTKLINWMSFNLEDRFLLFKTKDGGFCYLIGFADESLANAIELEGGKLALYPHLKVFLKGKGDNYGEITQEAYGGDSAAYFRSLKTAVVPFLVSIAVMVEFELSGALKRSFDMWT